MAATSSSTPSSFKRRFLEPELPYALFFPVQTRGVAQSPAWLPANAPRVRAVLSAVLTTRISASSRCRLWRRGMSSPIRALHHQVVCARRQYPLPIAPRDRFHQDKIKSARFTPAHFAGRRASRPRPARGRRRTNISGCSIKSRMRTRSPIWRLH